jgi:hypothetical protein
MRRSRGSTEPIVTEYQGFDMKTTYRLKKWIVAPKDHTCRIININPAKGIFTVLLKSKTCREANGPWGPVWPEELEKIETSEKTNGVPDIQNP